ncbi:MAG: RluA family pseudouridine synthase [Kiritimatiellae bacterium]|nr:RluA family pseudouridine synthase [Kiritimatiellia bacterium]
MRHVDILFEDDDIIAVNKPAGMIVHSAPGHEKEESLAGLLAASRPQMARVGSRERPGVVHRLDIDTSGVMIFAKSRRAYEGLRAAFESHDGVVKTYLAVLHGAIKPATGTLETTVGRKPWDSKRMAVDAPDGRRAVTRWTVLERHGPLALVEFVIETGRTHQIRVHAAHLGHPIAGDALYGDAAKDRRLAVPPRRQLLHAVQLEFRHPVTGRTMRLAAAPPNDMLYAR